MKKMNALEKEVALNIFKFYELIIDETLLDEKLVEERIINTVGFHTILQKNTILKVPATSDRFVFSDIEGKLNDQIDVGFNVYITNGFIDTLEGFVFGHGFGVSWPKKINCFAIYKKK